jgi:hypothetical protein
MARCDLTIRPKMTIAHVPSETYEEKLDSFRKYVWKLRKQHAYLLGHRGNADQTPVVFDML